jgi:tRNA(His) 5'-end guanylyltransferase
MAHSMQATMQYLCEHIQGCVLGYTQSDEITLVLVDYQNLNTDSWFDNNIQKMVSVAASMATWKFVDAMSSFMYLSNQNNPSVYEAALNKGVAFDCRAFNVPREDLLNCVLWRIKDCVRNSKQSFGQAHFSHKELHKKNTGEIISMVKEKTGIVWGDLPTRFKYGTFCVKTPDSGFALADKDIETYSDLETFFSEYGVFF